jgi:hypothetical protein
MPPNSTQNLNAKLSHAAPGQQRNGGPARSFASAPIQSSGPETKIVTGQSHYHGGYHLSV